jgi:DNA polymerase-3 subunit beta
MEFSIATETLKREVNLLQSVTEKKTGIGALSSILIETKDKHIQLTGTDLDNTIQVTLDADVKTEGSLCVSAKKLCDIVKSLGTGTITFKKEKNDWVQVKCNTSKFRVPGIAREQFPIIPEVTDTEVTLDGDSIKDLIAHTCFAVSQEESRYTLNGAKMEIANGKVSLATTDGHRIATMDDDIEDEKAELDILIPKKALTEIVKFVENEVVITQDTNHIKFVSGDRVLISRKFTANFPDYKAAIPKSNNIEVRFDVKELVQALKRNAIMSDERSCSVKIEIQKDQLILSSAHNGESEEIVACTTKNLPKDGLTIYVNWTYLVEYLDTCSSPVLKLKDGLSALEVVDSTSKYILMPLRPN